MHQLLIISIITLILLIFSAIPIIKLKYHHDMSFYIETFSKKCINDFSKIPEKNTYLFNICSSVLYDEKFADESFNNNKYNINSFKLYKEYVQYGTVSFAIFWIFFLSYLYLFIIYFNEKYLTYSLIFYLFLCILSYTVLYSLILKKITEIYKIYDTDIYKYYNTIYSINYGLKNKDIDTRKSMIQQIFYDCDDYIKYDIGLLIYNIDTVSKLGKKDINIPFIDHHDKENVNKIKSKIETVIFYLYVYLFQIILLIFFIFKTIKEKYDTIIIQILLVVIYLCIVFFYVLFRQLH